MANLIPRCLPALFLTMGVGTMACAAPIEFKHSGSGSGSIGGTPFPMSNFVITATGDTGLRQSFTNGHSIEHTSAVIDIAGVGSFTFTTLTKTFVYNDGKFVGFSRAPFGSLNLFNGPKHDDFAAWNMLSSIGPIAGASGSLLLWGVPNQEIQTSGGVLLFETASGFAASFTATIPVPAAFTIIVVSAFPLRRRRR